MCYCYCQWCPTCAYSSYDPSLSPGMAQSIHVAYSSPKYVNALPTNASRAMVEAAVRDYTLAITDNSLYSSGEPHVGHLAYFAQDEGLLKIIIDVISARLDLEWPHNYKAIEAANALPATSLFKQLGKLEKLAAPANGVYGQVEIRNICRPLYERVAAAKKKKDDEEAKKAQEAIMGMWGGLWHNKPAKPAPATFSFPVSGFPNSWQHPFPFRPPPASAAPAWPGKPPPGWKSWKADESRPPWGFTPQ